MKVSPFAGKPVEASMLANIPRLLTAYYTESPDPSVPDQRVAFGTSGHRGSAFKKAFNEDHILVITQAICLHRKRLRIDGPLFLGIDTHALSVPAYATALEVLAANGVEVMIAEGDEYTPTPMQFSLTTAIGRQVSPTGSSSRRRIIPRMTEVSSITLRKGGRLKPISPIGSKRSQMNFLRETFGM